MSSSVENSPTKMSDTSESQVSRGTYPDESQPFSDITSSQFSPFSPLSKTETDTNNNIEIQRLHEYAQTLNDETKDRVIRNFISSSKLSPSIKKRCLEMPGQGIFSQDDPSVNYDIMNQSDGTTSDNENVPKEDTPQEDTPQEVVNIVVHINEVTGSIDKLTNTELLNNTTLNEHLVDLQNKLDDLLKNDNIKADDLNGILNPDEIIENDTSSVISALSRSTITIMQHPNIVGSKGNVLVANKDRNANIKKIIDAMLENDFKRQMIMAQGSEKKLRAQFERNFDTDKQFVNVWGGTTGSVSEQAAFAKKQCCYLCGGQLITVDKVVSPEMEHKFPSLEFYTKVHNINEKYPDLLNKWNQYVENNKSRIQKLYSDINCNRETFVSNMGGSKPVEKVESKLNVELRVFIVEYNLEHDSHYSEEELLENKKFIALLKIHLMEFAYSHHTCNQIKENDNLNTGPSRKTYLTHINRAVDDGSFPSKGLLNNNSLIRETRNIKDNVFSEKVRNTRNNIIGVHMELMKKFIEDYALLFEDSTSRTKQGNAKINYLLKKIMTQSIKDSLNYIIKFKQDEKNRKMDEIRRKQSMNDTEKERIILDLLNKITLNKLAYDTATRRQKSGFYTKDDFINLITEISNDEDIKSAVLNGREGFNSMTPYNIYDNLVNSELGDNLVNIYNTNKYPFLNDDIALYFSDRLNDNNTSGDINEEEEEAKVEEKVEAEAKVEEEANMEDVNDPDSSFESAKESGNETDDTIMMDQANSSDGESSSGKMSLDSGNAPRDYSSDEGREPSDVGSGDDTLDPDLDPELSQIEASTMIPIHAAEQDYNTRSTSRSSNKTPVKTGKSMSKSKPTLTKITNRSQSAPTIIEQQSLRRSPRNKPFSGGKRKTNKMRQKQTPKRSMRRKTKNTRSSRKRTYRKTNTNKNTHTRRRR